MRAPVVTALVFVALVVAGVAGTTDRGALAVVATRGPVTPVCAVEVPCSGPAAGVPLVVRRAGQVVARAVTNGEGRARFSLLPGRYVVTAAYGGGLRPVTESASARVVAGRSIAVRFSFDTGIR